MNFFNEFKEHYLVIYIYLETSLFLQYIFSLSGLP